MSDLPPDHVYHLLSQLHLILARYSIPYVLIRESARDLSSPMQFLQASEHHLLLFQPSLDALQHREIQKKIEKHKIKLELEPSFGLHWDFPTLQHPRIWLYTAHETPEGYQISDGEERLETIYFHEIGRLKKVACHSGMFWSLESPETYLGRYFGPPDGGD